MPEYGITETGFSIKSMEVILEELRADFAAMFGTDIDTSTNSPEGQIINNFALKLALVWELLLAVVSMLNPNTAEDAALDALCAGNGISRKLPAPASVPVLHYGTTGTIIPAGNLVADALSNQYSLDVEIEIGLDSVGDAVISCPSPTGGVTYSVIINGVTISYLSDPGDTDYVIFTNLRNLINATPNIKEIITAFIDTGLNLLRVQSIDGGYIPFTLAVTNLEIDSYGTPGTYSCTVSGFLQPAVDSLTTIVNPISGLDSVNNISGGITGSNLETDEELRIRRLIELVSQSGSSEAAIASAIPQIVSGVTYCACKSNRTDTTDGDGRPPHSLEVTVEGGRALDIAQAIWNVAPAGIAFYGNTSYIIQDSNGDSQTIYYTVPQPVYIWIQTTVVHSNKEAMPVAAIEAIKTYIMNWAAGAVGVNKDVLVQEIFFPIYECPGVAECPELLIGQSSSSDVPPVFYSYANIEIGVRQLAAYDPARIEIEII